MKSIFTYVLIMFSFTSAAYAQTNFEINFGTTVNDIGTYAIQTFDGSYAVTGSSDSTGNGDIILSRVDGNGTVLWTKYIGGSMTDDGRVIRQTSDSGYVIAGTTQSFGMGMTDVILIRTDSNGDTLWMKTFGGGDFDFGMALQVTNDNGFIVAGQESSTFGGVASIFLVRTDAVGDTIWTRSIPMGAWTGATGIVQTADSGFVAFGDFENNSGTGDYDLVCIKMNSSGVTQWTKTYGDTAFNDYAHAIYPSIDGGFILTAERENIFSPGFASSQVLRIDANGDTLWTRVFGESYNYTILDITQSPDSGFVQTGYSFDPSFTVSTLFITKLSKAGDSLWTKYYSGLFNSSGNSINATSDGGLLICGGTSDSSSGQPNVYLLKTDGNGDLISCATAISSQPFDATVETGNDTLFYIETSMSVAGYQWQVDTGSGFMNLIDGGIYSGTNTDTLHITGSLLSMDGFQYRCVVAIDSICNETSNVATLMVYLQTGIAGQRMADISVFPNPARNEITVRGITSAIIRLYDVYGKYRCEFISGQSYNLSALSPGLYILKVFTEDNAEAGVLRVIKN